MITKKYISEIVKELLRHPQTNWEKTNLTDEVIYYFEDAHERGATNQEKKVIINFLQGLGLLNN